MPQISEPIFEPLPIDNYIEDDEKASKYPDNFYKKISCNFTKDTPLQTIILALGSDAGVSICLSDNVEGSTVLSINEKSFIDILDTICELNNLKYAIKDGTLIIEKDKPYIELYSIQFLNLSRESNGEISTSNDVFSGLSEGNDKTKTKKLDNVSSSSVKGNGKSDFWSELGMVLKTILLKPKGNYTIHRQCGMITVLGNSRQQNAIKQYISQLQKESSRQVLIEAKIVEVSLKNEYRSGINWYSKEGASFPVALKSYDQLSNSSQLTSFSLGYGNSLNFNTILKFIERFGSVKTISSPRITVLNNQSAVLKVAKNEIITKPGVYRQFSSSYDSRNSDSLYTDVQTIPIGLIFTVQPAIDYKRKNIILSLHPSLSRVVNYKKVPAYTTISGPRKNDFKDWAVVDIPIVESRELDSVLRVRSGEVVVLGGLMQERSHKERVGLPGNSKGILDIFFGSRAQKTETTELIIFLRARIVDSNKQPYITTQNSCLAKQNTKQI